MAYTKEEHIKNESKTAAFNPFVGLTKREYFAAMALRGLLSGCLAHPETTAYPAPGAAAEAVNMADALIAALNA